MGTEAFTIRTNSKKVQELDKLGSTLDRSRNYLVNQAIDNLLEVHQWQIEETKKGIVAANRGDFATDKEMQKILDKYKG
jgi:predicted transcriptional regulator